MLSWSAPARARAVVMFAVYVVLALPVRVIGYYAVQLHHNAAFRHYDDRYHITAKILQDTHPATRAAGQGGGPLKDVTVGAASFVSQLNTVLAVTFLLVLHGRPYVELGLSLAGRRQQGYRQVIIGIKDAVAG
jgi:hypothetical protein